MLSTDIEHVANPIQLIEANAPAHDRQFERQHADQPEAHFHRQVRRLPERRHHTGRGLQVAAQQLHQGAEYPDQKKGGKKTMHGGLMKSGKALSMSMIGAFAYPSALAPAR